MSRRDKKRNTRPNSGPEVKDLEPVSSFGWKQRDVLDALECIELGQMARGQELMLAITRHPKVKHGLKMRRDKLRQVPFHFDKPEALPQVAFDRWVSWWPICWPRQYQGLANQHRIMLGTAPLNTTWELDRKLPYWMPRIHTKEPCSLEWYETDRLYRFHTYDGKQFPMEPLDGAKWLLMAEEPLRPHHHGIVRSLAAAWYMGEEALRWWNSHNRSHGQEWRALKFPAQMRRKPEFEDLYQACVELEGGGVIPLPQYDGEPGKAQYGLEQLAAQTNAAMTFEGLRRLSDDYITLLLLGVLETTKDGGGSLAKATQQARESLAFTRSDCLSVIEIHDAIVRKWCEVNRLDPDAAPRLIADVDPPEDANLKAERYQKQADAGAKFASMLEGLERINAARKTAGKPEIEYEPEAIAEQYGFILTRAQDGEQSPDL